MKIARSNGWRGPLGAVLLTLAASGCTGDDDDGTPPGDDDVSGTPLTGDDDASSPTPAGTSAPGDDDSSSPTPSDTSIPGDDDSSSPTPPPGDDDTTTATPAPGIDADGDGYEAPADCDDADASVHPGAIADECTDGVDHDCDGSVGVLISDGGDLAVDIASVYVTFSVTLAGKPIGAGNASATDYGSIRLRSAATGETFKAGDLWNLSSDQPQGTFSNRVAPGSYDILYSVGENGANAPDNEDAVLKAAVPLTSSQTVAVDIPVVTVSFTATLGGKALSSSNTSAYDYGTLSLRDTATGEKFPLYSTWSTSSSKLTASYAARLVPGTYDVLYESGEDGSNWPANDATTIRSAVPFTSSQSYTIDVPVVSVTVTPTLNGKPASSSNTSDKDYGKLELRDVATGDSFKLYDTFDTSKGAAVASFTGHVLPGTYDLLYSIQEDGDNWPVNKNAVISSAVAITAATSLTPALQSVKQTFTVTLGGKTVNGSNTSATDNGAIRLRELTGSSFKVFDTWSNGSSAPVNTWTGPVIPGTYDLLYAVESGGANWPLNEKVLLRSGVALTGNGSLSIDVPVASITCDLTLGGEAAGSSNTGADDYGRLVVRDTVSDDRFKLCSAWDSSTGAIGVPATVKVVPGSYELLYDSGIAGSSWPGSHDVVLKTGRTLADGQTVTLDVPVAVVHVAVTLGGVAVSDANTTATDYGTLELEDPIEGSDRFTAWSAWDDALQAAVSERSIPLLPGSYRYLYTAGEDGVSWPADQARPLGCFTTR